MRDPLSQAFDQLVAEGVIVPVEGKRRFELSESTKRDLVSKRMAHLPRWIAP